MGCTKYFAEYKKFLDLEIISVLYIFMSYFKEREKKIPLKYLILNWLFIYHIEINSDIKNIIIGYKNS